MLFRIAFMVDKKDVGECYARLTGLKLHNVEAPQEVVFADDRPAETILDLSGRKQIAVREVAAALKSAGKSPGSATYHITKWKNAGLVKPTKERGVYDVVAKAKKKGASK